VSAIILASGLVACGGGDDVSQEDVDRAAAKAVQKEREQQRLRKLEKQLNQLKKERGSESSPSSSSSPTSGTEDCGGGVSVNGETTSCAFGLNVAEEYSIGGESEIAVYSPTTGETYSMTCTSSGSTVVCRGGNNAVVYIH
jgi:hypothetical protein